MVFKGYVEQLAHEKGRDKDLALYAKIERMAPQLIAEERKIFKGVSPNVDFYSGFVYDMLGIPMELYTPLFAVARIMAGVPTASKSCSAPTRSSVRLQEPGRHPRLHPAGCTITGGLCHETGSHAEAPGRMVLLAQF